MKKNIFFIICTFILKQQISGQTNLVPNPGFEADTACPNNAGEIYYARPWFQPNYYFGTVISASSSDLYNQCAPFGNTSVPVNNYSGHQVPKTGSGYTGASLRNSGSTSSVEYIETSLSTSLLAGKTYCINMYVSLADSAAYAISNIGAYFCNDSLLYSSSTYSNIPVIPQFENPNSNVVTDKNNWTLISGQFIAAGGERFMTIGNFRDNASSPVQVVGGAVLIAYYYFDDISVVCCDCDTVVPTPDLVIPTLLGNEKMFEIKGLPANSTLFLFNSIGQVVFNVSDYNNKLNLINFSGGIYFYYLRLADGTFYKGKLVVVN